MKLPALYSLLRLAGSVAAILIATGDRSLAGSSAGGAQLAPVDNTSAAVYKPAAAAVPGGNAYGGAGTSADSNNGGSTTGSSASSQNSSGNPGSSNNSSVASNSGSASDQAGQFGRPTSGNPFGSAGVAREGASTGSYSSSRFGKEKMIVVPDEKSAPVNTAPKSEVTKKFEPSLLDAGLTTNSTAALDGQTVSKPALEPKRVVSGDEMSKSKHDKPSHSTSADSASPEEKAPHAEKP
jgi:hypothetical protein